MYYATDDLYLGHLARFVKPGGQIAIAGAGLMQKIGGAPPGHLREWWTQDLWCLHSADWWRRHWERAGIVDIEIASSMPDGWQLWIDWHADRSRQHRGDSGSRGRLRQISGLGCVIARRRTDAQLAEPIESVPAQYTKQPLLRGEH